MFYSFKNPRFGEVVYIRSAYLTPIIMWQQFNVGRLKSLRLNQVEAIGSCDEIYY